MKKKSIKVSTLLKLICTGGMAMLGFACSNSDEPNSCMYGTPYSEFEIKGSVVDEDGQAVENATVIVTEKNVSSDKLQYGKAASSADGTFNIVNTCGGSAAELKVVCTPHDSKLEADSMVIATQSVSTEKPNSWYMGLYHATVNFVLKKKK